MGILFGFDVAKIKGKFSNRPNLIKVIANTGWLFADKLLRMGVGVIVGVWVARYLGPAQFGLWNYAISFSALLSVLGTLSMDSIIVRDLLKDPDNKDTLLGTSFVLRLVGAILALIITVIAVYFVRMGDRLTVWLVALSSAGFIFQSVNVIDFYFQARWQSKFTVYAQNAAFILTTIIKIVLLIKKASLIFFAVTSLVELILAGLFIIFAFNYNHQSIRSWKFSASLAKKMLKDSAPLILSGITIMIYMRLDQVMLGQMLNDEAVGVYTAAIKLSEVWYFIPISIASSVFPVIIQSKEQGENIYRERMQKMYDFMAILGISVALATTFLSPFVIKLLYGPQYAASANVLTVTIWTGVMVCLSTLHSRWLLLENLQKISLLYTTIGAISNFIANLFLIKYLGIIGAAYGTLIAQFTPFIVALGFKRVRKNLVMMLNAIFSPVRFFFVTLKRFLNAI